jgi:nucleoside-diphosphate-sugar epimerase
VTNKVLVAGASGLVGEAAVRRFARRPGWNVVGVSRRVPEDAGNTVFHSIDLTDAAASQELFGKMGDVTHLVYAALQETPGLFEGWLDEANIERNALMLRNLFEPLSEVATGLRHISLLHGTKAYGVHHPSLGYDGLRIPLRERDPRREHRNFYFDQESYLREKQVPGTWQMTVFRPTVIYGEAAGNNMNPLLPIAVYGALLREEGRPLDHPVGSLEPWLREAVHADLVADALSWAATSPAAAGGTYNLTNGDVFTWANVWPAIARTLGMPLGAPREVSLLEELPRRRQEWAAIVAKYGLSSSPDVMELVGYNSLVYADNLMRGAPAAQPVPALNSTVAVRHAGFGACIDTEDMFVELLQRLEAKRVIPPAGIS